MVRMHWICFANGVKHSRCYYNMEQALTENNSGIGFARNRIMIDFGEVCFEDWVVPTVGSFAEKCCSVPA